MKCLFCNKEIAVDPYQTTPDGYDVEIHDMQATVYLHPDCLPKLISKYVDWKLNDKLRPYYGYEWDEKEVDGVKVHTLRYCKKNYDDGTDEEVNTLLNRINGYRKGWKGDNIYIHHH